MSVVDTILLRLADLGRGLRKSADGKSVEAFPSAVANNLLGYGPDGGLVVAGAAATGSNTTLPAATAANQGADLVVDANGNWIINPLSGPIVNWPALV